jgi:hypothetical protein
LSLTQIIKKTMFKTGYKMARAVSLVWQRGLPSKLFEAMEFDQGMLPSGVLRRDGILSHSRFAPRHRRASRTGEAKRAAETVRMHPCTKILVDLG